MGVKVEIRDLSLSWSQGVSITGLVFHSPEGFDDKPMLNISEMNGLGARSTLVGVFRAKPDTTGPACAQCIQHGIFARYCTLLNGSGG